MRREDDVVQQYLTRARHCVEIAGTMSDMQQKLILLDMAQVWIRLANHRQTEPPDGFQETPKVTTPPPADT